MKCSISSLKLLWQHLIWIKRNKKIPSEIEIEIISNKTSLDEYVQSPPREEDDITMITDPIGPSHYKKSPEGEKKISNNKNFKRNTEKVNPARKRFKSTSHAGISNDQVDISSFTGRKFEYMNNICYINSVLNGLMALSTVSTGEN